MAGSVNSETCERGGKKFCSRGWRSLLTAAGGLLDRLQPAGYPSCPLAQPPPLNWPRRYCLGICPPLLPSCTLSQSSIHSHARPAGAQGGRWCQMSGTWSRASPAPLSIHFVHPLQC